MTYISSYSKWDNEYRKAKESDEKARKSGLIVGRLMSLQRYDGYAHYVIESQDNKNYYLRHLNIYDGYTDTIIELFDRALPLSVVCRYFKERDEMLKVVSQ